MSFVRTEPGAGPIIVEASLAAPPSEVFDAWTNAARVKQWFGMTPGSVEHASIDLEPGGRWRFVEAADSERTVGFEGVYIVIVPDRRLVFSWTKFTEHATGDTTVTPPSQVEITLTETTHGTDMRIVHSAVDPANAGFAIGWNSGIANLVALLDPSQL